jgi:hypothetical protein
MNASRHTYDTNTISLRTVPREMQRVRTCTTNDLGHMSTRDTDLVSEHNGHNDHTRTDTD